MKRLLVDPLDVLMFKSERPFIARESHVAKLGIVSPLIFEGALKSKVLTEFCKEINYPISNLQRKKNISEEKFKEEIKKDIQINKELRLILEAIGYSPLEFKSKINVVGVFFARNGEEYLQVPNDLLIDEENNKLTILKPALREDLKISGTEFYICFSKHSKVKPVEGLISFKGLIKYLKGEIPNKSDLVEKPYTNEFRTGIRIEKRKKTSVEGYLYVAEFLRLKDEWKFIVWFEDYDDLVEKYIKASPLIRLGGEGKGAICKVIDGVISIDAQSIVDELNKEKKFKLYIASPAYFGGYKPNENLLKKYLGVDELKLISALPGKPLYIGGYDLAMNKEKPLRRWVNAGAVYYYKFDGKVRDDLTLPIKIIDGNMDMRCAFIGRW